MSSNWLIISELANQLSRRALSTYVWYLLKTIKLFFQVHQRPHALLAQWQSTGLVNQGSGVQTSHKAITKLFMSSFSKTNCFLRYFDHYAAKYIVPNIKKKTVRYVNSFSPVSIFLRVSSGR